MNLISRIKRIAENEGITISALERRIGASKGVISRALQNESDIQAKWVTSIVYNFPMYDPKWLLTGEGKMIRDGECDGPKTVNNFSGGSIYSAGGGNNRNNTAQEDGQAYQAGAKLRETEIGRLVAQYRDFIDHLNAQIKEKDEQLRAKDEQITRLLSIITPHPKG